MAKRKSLREKLADMLRDAGYEVAQWQLASRADDSWRWRAYCKPISGEERLTMNRLHFTSLELHSSDTMADCVQNGIRIFASHIEIGVRLVVAKSSPCSRTDAFYVSPTGYRAARRGDELAQFRALADRAARMMHDLGPMDIPHLDLCAMGQGEGTEPCNCWAALVMDLAELSELNKEGDDGDA